MDLFDGTNYSYSKNYLSYIGLWPLQKDKTKYLLGVATIFIFLSCFIPLIINMMDVRKSFHQFLQCIPILAFYLEFGMNTYHLMFHRNKHKKILNSIKRDFEICSEKQIKILNDYAKQAKKINTFGVYIVMFGFICFNFIPLIPTLLTTIVQKNLSLHIESQTFLKYHIKSMDDNVFTVFYSIFCNFVGVLTCLGFESLNFTACLHACALFRIVNSELKDIIEHPQTKITEGKSFQRYKNKFYERIVTVIIIHKRAIEHVNLLNSCYTMWNFYDLGTRIISISVTQFQAIRNKRDANTRIQFIIYSILLFIHCFIQNYPGQMIKEYSETICQSCYCTEWYQKNTSTEDKKLLIFIMQRTHKPNQFTAGRVFLLNFTTFIKVLKTSFSYCTFFAAI